MRTEMGLLLKDWGLLKSQGKGIIYVLIGGAALMVGTLDNPKIDREESAAFLGVYIIVTMAVYFSNMLAYDETRRSSTSSARTIVSWKAAKPFIGTTKYWNGLRPPLGRLSGVTSQSLKFETKDAAQANGGLTSTAGEKSTKPFVLPGFASA